VHHSLTLVRKCNNIRDPNELLSFWPLNSSDFNTFYYKIWGSKSTRNNALDVNDLRWHLIDMRVFSVVNKNNDAG